MPLELKPNFGIPGQPPLRDFTPGDDFYEALIETHRDLATADSHALNARLVLLLANHIGDLTLLREALSLAREGL